MNPQLFSVNVCQFREHGFRVTVIDPEGQTTSAPRDSLSECWMIAEQVMADYRRRIRNV